jgi:hypothetical protein
MTTSPPHRPKPTPAHRAVADVRRLLLDLGADADVLDGVVVRQDLTGREYVRIPPLPVDVAEHLVRLLPAGAGA